MRSGHYKLSCSKSAGDGGTNGISIGQFKTACRELPPLLALTKKPESPPALVPEFPHLNSLSLIKSHDHDPKLSNKQTTNELERILRHRSCENISALACNQKGGAVKQKVRSLLMRNEAKRRPELPPFDCSSVRSDVWQAGKIVIRRPRITTAHSHSALHTLGGSSDTASCMSASSGYSSSNSSSYGSFKSCGSLNSSLQRQRNDSAGSSSPGSDTGRVLFVDNPLYDITPAAAARLSDISRSYENSLLESLSSGEYSLGEVNLPEEVEEDPVARDCREYFEKRVRTSEKLRKRWSISLPRPKTKYSDSELISRGDAVIDSRLNPDLTSTLDSGVGVESNALPLDDDLEEFSQDSLEFYMNAPEEDTTRKKTHLDEKMEFLRHEIASLMQQDNTLFKQLLTLSASITSLKIQNAFLNQQPLRSLTPSSLDSFTEEEEDFEEEIRSNTHQQSQKNTQNKDQIVSQVDVKLSSNDELISVKKEVAKIDDEEDEGHCTDLSLGHTPNSSPTQSPSPSSTLSSKGSTCSRNLSKSSLDSSSSASFIRCRKSYAPNARNRRRASSVTAQKSPQIVCGTTTALVVIHTEDDLSFLNIGRPRANTSINNRSRDNESTAFSFLDKSSMAIMRSLSQNSSSLNSTKLSVGKQGGIGSKKRTNSQKNVSKIQIGKCSKENVSVPSLRNSVPVRPNLSHPPYREALIM